jgi:ribosomal protein S17E
LQASSTSSGDSNNNNNNRSTFEKNKQLVERFLQTIKSNVTRVNSLDYINGYMRHWHLYEEKKEDEEAEEEEEGGG